MWPRSPVSTDPLKGIIKMLCQVIATAIVSALISYLVKFAVMASACALALTAMTAPLPRNHSSLSSASLICLLGAASAIPISAPSGGAVRLDGTGGLLVVVVFRSPSWRSRHR